MRHEEILRLMPHARPFRFLDRIERVDEQEIVGRYRFREDEAFYAGHFPGNPITPGVILLETLAQTGVVAFGLYLASLEMSREELSGFLTLFTEADVEFTGIVRPGTEVTVHARKQYFRRLKLKSEAEMKVAGKVVCRGRVAGIGVRDS